MHKFIYFSGEGLQLVLSLNRFKLTNLFKSIQPLKKAIQVFFIFLVFDGI